MNDLSPGLLRTLAVLRWWAVAGQALTVLLVVHAWGLPLRAAALWSGVAVLAAFNLWATWHAARNANPSAAQSARAERAAERMDALRGLILAKMLSRHREACFHYTA